MTTSQIARERFEAEGKKAKHHQIILWVLKKYGPGTNYSIAKNAYYTGKDRFGNKQTFKLNYYQVNKRTSELLRLNKIKFIKQVIDEDGATRNLYDLV